jgi:hypothetical protein
MAKGGKTVGYGLKGGKFKNQAKYNASKSGQMHAKNPNLSVKPIATGKEGNVFFSPGKYAASPSGRHTPRPAGLPTGGPPQAHSAGQRAHFATAEVSKATPTPKTPAGMKPMPVQAARGMAAPRGMK